MKNFHMIMSILWMVTAVIACCSGQETALWMGCLICSTIYTATGDR